jgi:diketogulonate reductase-like aldo/keto reductase
MVEPTGPIMDDPNLTDKPGNPAKSHCSREPYLGFGTYLIADDEVAAGVSEAIRAGYRHIDTTEGYHNESGVGAGIKQGGQAAARHRTEVMASARGAEALDSGHRLP